VTEGPVYVLREYVAPLLRQVPFVRGAVRGTMNTVFRVALLPFGRNRRSGVAQESQALVQDTDRLNVAAEHYFAEFDQTPFLLRKPFSDESGFAKHLFNLGVLLHGLRLRRSDVVMEFGAGSCWVSHFLNRYGCRTIAVDVSSTALDLGREIFRRDPDTNWDVKPEFLPYDGHRLPMPDASVDKVIIFDAFHHVPNQREILTELVRVLRPNGIVAMSEPGKGHADTEASRHEVETYGVLENELVAEDVGELARACGFRAAHLIVASPQSLWEIPAEDLGPFIQGKGFTRFWETQSDALVTGHYFLLYKGDPQPTTREPKALGAQIEIAGARRGLQVRRGEPAVVRVKIRNVCETRWLAGEQSGIGWTRLGAHLLSAEDSSVVDFDWLRVELPQDVSRDETFRLTVTLPPIESPGTYEVVFDLVIEGMAWFVDRGSRATALTLHVSD
jgi:SAM-dependent methyltransferase